MEKSDVFRIAGSISDESEEELLGHVLKVVGYTSNIHRLVRQSFNFCDTHKVATPRVPKTRMPRTAVCSCPPLPRK